MTGKASFETLLVQLAFTIFCTNPRGRICSLFIIQEFMKYPDFDPFLRPRREMPFSGIRNRNEEEGGGIKVSIIDIFSSL